MEQRNWNYYLSSKSYTKRNLNCVQIDIELAKNTASFFVSVKHWLSKGVHTKMLTLAQCLLQHEAVTSGKTLHYSIEPLQPHIPGRLPCEVEVFNSYFHDNICQYLNWTFFIVCPHFSCHCGEVTYSHKFSSCHMVNTPLQL